MRPCYVRKRIGSRLYKLMLREEKHWAERAARVYRDEGYLAAVLPDPKKPGNYEVWRSVRKAKTKG